MYTEGEVSKPHFKSVIIKVIFYPNSGNLCQVKAFLLAYRKSPIQEASLKYSQVEKKICLNGDLPVLICYMTHRVSCFV